MTRCFVIGPIGNRLAELGSESRTVYEDALAVFEDVIRPACKENGLDPIRADGIAVPGEITEQIFRHLFEDEVVIADVSGANPNVMYELGLRHTRNLLTIQIGEFGQLPFDVGAVRTIQFSRSERGLIDARNNLSKALQIGLADGGNPVAATRIWNALPADDVPPLEVEEEDDQESDDDGLFERMQKIETAFPSMTETLESLTEVMEQMGADATAFAEELDALNASDAPTAQRMSVLARYAATLQKPADEFTFLTDRFTEQMSETDVAVRGILRDMNRNPVLMDGEGPSEFLETIASLAGDGREAMEMLGDFGDQVYVLGSLSRVLRRPAKQIKDGVRKMSSATTVMDEWESTVARMKTSARQPQAGNATDISDEV